MRYSDRITFITETEGGYNPDTGNFDEAVPIKNTMPCNISPLGVDRTVQMFGEMDTVIVVARLQRPHDGVFDYAEISGSKFNVKRHIPLRTESVFYLEGVKS